MLKQLECVCVVYEMADRTNEREFYIDKTLARTLSSISEIYCWVRSIKHGSYAWCDKDRFQLVYLIEQNTSISETSDMSIVQCDEKSINAVGAMC